jgi:hypothetical protein
MNMVKDLFVRGFDEKLHAKATQIAINDQVTLGSIVKDAIDKWIKNYEKNRHKHNLILYSDEVSLRKILDEIDKFASDNWLKSFCGPSKHSGTQILSKRDWFDAAANNYGDLLEKPQETGVKVIETISSKIESSRSSKSGYGVRNTTGLLPLTVAFLVDDLAREHSVKKAAGFCEWYERKSIPGITFCIANTKNILTGTFDDLFELFNSHSGVFLAKSKKIYKINLDDAQFSSLFI